MHKKILTKLLRSSVVVALSAFCILALADISWMQMTTSVAQAGTGQTAVVTGTNVNLRSNPGTSHPIQGQVVEGDRLPVLARQGDWLQVQGSNGQTAWIAAWLVRLEETNTGSQTAVVRSNEVNLRQGPGTSYALAGQVVEGDRLPILNKEGHWLEVQCSNGQSAWIAAWLVGVEGAGQQSNSSPAPAINKYVVLIGDQVNVRSGPGLEHNIVAVVNSGERYTWLSEFEQWYKMQLADGKEGWVANWLAKVEEVTSPAETPSRGDTADRSPTDSNLLAWLPEPTKDKQYKDEDKVENKDKTKDNGSQLKDIDVEVKGDSTTLRIKADSALNYNSFTLTNPSRLVINLEGVTLGDVLESQEIRSSTITSYRTGQFSSQPMTSRVVLELKGNAHYRTELSPDEKTLSIETFLAGNGQHVQNKVIFIDPGHGGSDPGAPGYSPDVWEAELVLDISKRLAELLRQQGARVEMSRQANSTVDLYERPGMANRLNADIFVSVHANANNNSAIRGTSTYYYAPTNVPELREQLSDRTRLAQSIQTEMVHGLKLDDKGIIQANFAVLRASKMPSVLVETAFISNPEEERLLRDSNFRQQTAEAMARGINAYFQGK